LSSPWSEIRQYLDPFEWITDSGLLTVDAPPADSIFAGDIDAWFHDTRTLGHPT
jgi:hypothetical protein